MSAATAIYTRGAQIFHWSMTMLLIVLVWGGWSLDDLSGPDRQQAVGDHAATGIVFLIVFVIRLMWRIRHRPPPLPKVIVRPFRQAAHATHAGLYIMMGVVPVAGLTAVAAHELPISIFGSVPVGGGGRLSLGLEDFDVLRLTHEVLGWGLLLLCIAHIGAIIFHQFIVKHRVVHRMFGGWSNGSRRTAG